MMVGERRDWLVGGFVFIVMALFVISPPDPRWTFGIRSLRNKKKLGWINKFEWMCQEDVV